VRPEQPTAAGAGNDARPGGIGEVLTSALIGGVPALLDEVRTMLAPEYAEYLIEGRAAVVVAAEAAMEAFVQHAQRCLSFTQSPEEVELLPDTALSMFEEVGRNQWSEGFALRTLLSAYQVGGRVAWRHVAATSLRSGVGAEALTALAEAVFYFVDELCAASTDGYVAVQTATVAEREHRRDILVELLLSDRSESTAAASEAGWALPQYAAVVFVQPGNESARHALTRLGPHCLPVRNSALPGMIVPDANGPGAARPPHRVAARVRGCCGPVRPAAPAAGQRTPG